MFLVVLSLCFDVAAVGRWNDDVEVAFIVAEGGLEADLGAMQVCFDDLLVFLDAPVRFGEQFSNLFVVFYADVDGLTVDTFFSLDVVEVVLFDGLDAMQA